MLTWADGLVALTLGVAFWGGYRSGLIREIVGIAAVIVSWLAAGLFAGSLAATLQSTYALGTGSSHLLAFWLLFLLIFAAVRAAGWVSERFASLPGLRIASGISGGAVACAKAVLLLWLVIFVALFFPIAPDVRSVLRSSPTVEAIETLNGPAYAMIGEALPHGVRPFGRLILKRHRL
ncbi:MAG: CvpA family protein [Candidatus Eremiobacter antarcticus]|nr:CvpA family protein [Candidatus Eremiobacteraeota bacterium]MBC5808376.1 CvpA family protein [Candidatus Eremiobacteraeota bacterium]